jgi:hypothetical protein
MRSALLALVLATSLPATRLAITGFEPGTVAEGLTSGTVAPTVQGTVKRSGAYALQVAVTGSATGVFQVSRVQTTNGTPSSTFNMAAVLLKWAFAWEVKPGGSDEIYACRDSGGVYKLAVRLNSDATLGLYGAGGTTLIANGTTQLVQNRFYELELDCRNGATAAYELRINGVTELIGTADQGATNVDTIRLGKNTNRNSGALTAYYDDIIADDTDFPGSSRVGVLKPNASGFYTAWTPVGAATDWEATSGLPASFTTHILSTLVVDDAATMNLEDTGTAGISGTIRAVKAFVMLIRDAATNSAARTRIRSGTTNSDTAANATVSSTTVYLSLIAAVDPATSAAWTLSALDAVQAGPVGKSAAGASRAGEVLLMVEYAPAASTVFPSINNPVRSTWR